MKPDKLIRILMQIDGLTIIPHWRVLTIVRELDATFRDYPRFRGLLAPFLVYLYRPFYGITGPEDLDIQYDEWLDALPLWVRNRFFSQPENYVPDVTITRLFVDNVKTLRLLLGVK